MFNSWYFFRGLEERQHYFSSQKRKQELFEELLTNKPASYI